MFHEEKIIDGVLCFRNTPDGEFKPMSLEMLTQVIVRLEKELEIADTYRKDVIRNR